MNLNQLALPTGKTPQQLRFWGLGLGMKLGENEDLPPILAGMFISAHCVHSHYPASQVGVDTDDCKIMECPNCREQWTEHLTSEDCINKNVVTVITSDEVEA